MYRCNETGREFEEPRYDPDFWNKGDGAKVCPCCDVLDGNSWADLKKIYKEAKKNGTVTL